MNNLIKLLKKKNIMISSCESFTVGKFGASVGSVSGASSVYRGSLTSYQTVIKETVLGIEHNLIKEYGVVSKEIAIKMCENGNKLFKSDLCVSFTGNAGPEAMENKPVGLIYIGICFGNKSVAYEYNLNGTREEIQNEAVQIAVELIIKMLVLN